MNKSKIRVCIIINKELNEKFKKRFPLMLSRYVEKCIKDALKDSKKVLDSVESEEKFSIFNLGIKR